MSPDEPFADNQEPPIYNCDGIFAIGISPTEHPAASVDRTIEALAKGILMNAEAIDDSDEASRLIYRAAELNDRRIQPEALPIEPDGHPDYDPTDDVDESLNDLLDYVQQFPTEDEDFARHLREMEKEIKARIRGGDTQ